VMIQLKDHKVLVVAPHPDDEVFGCGGFIHRVKREGGKVYVLFMTVGTTKDFSRRGISTSRERLRELEHVAKYLDFDNYKIAFPGDSYHLRLDMIPQKDLVNEIERGEGISLEAIQPTIVVRHPTHDYNQDHRAVASAVITATRPASPSLKSLQRIILTAEMPTDSWTHEETLAPPNFFVTLDADDLHAKVKALRLYASQMKHGSNLLSERAVNSLAQLRGMQSGGSFAEAFFTKRLIA
jgi:N-acetylglucosamine malate deacetylase 1